MWQVRREKLNTVLDIIAMVPEKIGALPSEYIKITGKGSRITLSVASYMFGQTSLEGEGEWPFKDPFFLDRRTFIPWVNAARESKDKHRFQFHGKKDQLYLKHGNRTVLFTNQKKISGYGDLKKIKAESDHSVPVSDELIEMLRCGNNCAVSDTIQPHLNAVVTAGKKGKVVSYAASNYVHYIGEGSLGRGEAIDSVPFPLFLIPLLEVEGLKTVSCIGKYVVLNFKHGTIWQPVSEEAIKNFPLRKIKRYAKKSEDLNETFSTSGRRFSRMMVRLGYYLQSVRRRDWVAVVIGNKGKESIELRSKIPGVDFKETISVAGKIAKDFKIEWPLATLAPVFEFLSKRSRKVPLTVRIDHKHKISYVKAGRFWLCVPSRQEEV